MNTVLEVDCVGDKYVGYHCRKFQLKGLVLAWWAEVL